ncbi:MAG: hypothetical protein A2W90_18055 [Bacteroidetes bacterium GWF2_42_66]|nr:MAG: hypothetical protein A2W92_22315 [Bacteroidetes bacterium GWA2_42_15]OFX98156.1 MAG: hypothetical protein A2W89_09545 [Bacteroidetes bacterium GWE2_42_39]OFY42541.1 MAG: hypothetical protein A2W90_18055 [Bacteroidetes bacterium GWF2_42_66]HBL74257.1 hypothetical protein [Prolixibacteraceae bacterium]HCU64026.1 hypothetical protein [Prolixibacteraceae bacterium]
MANQTLSVIKNWFRTGLKPTQAQFWDTWDSFWHKDEKIPIDTVDQLITTLNSKVSQQYVDNSLAALAATGKADTVNLIPGTQTVNFRTAFAEGTEYVLFHECTDANGYEVGNDITTPTHESFDITVDVVCTLKYMATIKR